MKSIKEMEFDMHKEFHESYRNLWKLEAAKLDSCIMVLDTIRSITEGDPNTLIHNMALDTLKRLGWVPPENESKPS